MRGSPLFRAALAVIALLTLLIPLRSLTGVRLAPAEARSVPDEAPAPVHLLLVSTAAPFTFAVSHLGKVIWQGESPDSSVETDIAMAYPKEGIDLTLDAKWPSRQTGAVKLAVSRGADDPIIQTVWGEGSASDVLTFK